MLSLQEITQANLLKSTLGSPSNGISLFSYFCPFMLPSSKLLLYSLSLGVYLSQNWPQTLPQYFSIFHIIADFEYKQINSFQFKKTEGDYEFQNLKKFSQVLLPIKWNLVRFQISFILRLEFPKAILIFLTLCIMNRHIHTSTPRNLFFE